MSFFLVQWLKASCQDSAAIAKDINYEFSIISLRDIKEEYRYTLDEGRITMALYHHRSGHNLGTMYKLCKILRRSKDKSALEKQMMHIVNTPISPHENKQKYPGENQEAKPITTEYVIEDNDQNCSHVTNTSSTRHNPTSRLSAPHGHPRIIKRPRLIDNWDQDEEIAALLEENHRLRRENDMLREKLHDAIDVSDFKNILESTLLNIQQKQRANDTPPHPITSASACSYRHETPNAPGSEDIPVQYMHQHYTKTSRPPQAARDSQVGRRHLISQLSRNMMNHRTESSQMIEGHSAHQRCTNITPAMDSDEPYIVRVQSLAEPSTNSRVSATNESFIPTINHSHQGCTTDRTEAPQKDVSDARVSSQPQEYGERNTEPSVEHKMEEECVEYVQTIHVQQPCNTSNSMNENNLEVPIPVHLHPTQMHVPHPNDIPSAHHDEEELVELSPNTGVMLNSKALKMAQKAKNFSQFTRNLMTLIFTPLQMNTCSVTGERATGRGSAGVEQRPALGRQQVQAIVSAVQKRYRGTTSYQVRSTMGQKLVDCRKVFKNKQLKEAMWRSYQQELRS